jgi:hypothetical protein
MKDNTMMNVIAYQEGGVWIAQGIEIDIVARANSLDAVQVAFSKAVARTMVVSQSLHGQPFAGIGKAPDRFKVMFDRAHSRLVPIVPLNFGADNTNVDIRLAIAS